MLLMTDNLTKCYGNFRALDALSLQVGQGEVFGLLGPNGSGKSTTIRLLLGMIRPTSGTARVGGFDSWRHSVEVRKQVAYLPGELRLYDNLTGWELLHFLAGLRGQNVDADAHRLARRFDIDLHRPLANLSSGMKRKLALMSVILPRVPLVILDEPTNTLDPTMRDEFLDQVVEAKQRGQTVLFSSHVLQEVERVCDRVGILSKGKLVHLQCVDELRSGKRATVRFEREPHQGLPPEVALAGQRDLEWTLELRGDVQPLIAWLAEQAVVDLRMEPLGLMGVYARYHAAEVAAA
jgi:ABC-2 type transport system ATP-binding protein